MLPLGEHELNTTNRLYLISINLNCSLDQRWIRSTIKNPDKYLKLEIISRILEERRQKRIKDDTMQALDSLAMGSNNSLSADTSTIFSTNQSLIVLFHEKSRNR